MVFIIHQVIAVSSRGEIIQFVANLTQGDFNVTNDIISFCPFVVNV